MIFSSDGKSLTCLNARIVLHLPKNLRHDLGGEGFFSGFFGDGPIHVRYAAADTRFQLVQHPTTPLQLKTKPRRPIDSSFPASAWERTVLEAPPHSHRLSIIPHTPKTRQSRQSLEDSAFQGRALEREHSCPICVAADTRFQLVQHPTTPLQLKTKPHSSTY